MSTKETPYVMDDIDRSIIRATQGGLPRVSNPYQVVADQVGLGHEDVLIRMRRMLDAGVIRRIGVIPNHYALGYTANGMTVWDVLDDDVLRLGEKIGNLHFVSHCYRRPRHLPDWSYNLFAMVHGRSREEVEKQALVIADLLGNACEGHEVLYSTRILKKTGLRLAA